MTSPVRIPSNVDIPDRVIGPLTARQLAILAVTGLLLYAIWVITRSFLPLPVFVVLALPVVVAATALALGQRDGLPLDRFLLAALQQRLQPRYQVAAPEEIRPAPPWLTLHATYDSDDVEMSLAPLEFPAREVTDTGVVDLGEDGLAVIAVASTVNFALRTPIEQEALVANFGRWLHSLTGPVQILVRTEHVDLTDHITHLRERASSLPHPALEAAAHEHAEFLTTLSDHTDLLRRRVLLIFREPTTTTDSPTSQALPPRIGRRRTNRSLDSGARRAAEARLARRLTEATGLLAPTGITITALDGNQVTAVLAVACNPDTLLPASPALAAPNDIITTAPRDDHDDGGL